MLAQRALDTKTKGVYPCAAPFVDFDAMTKPRPRVAMVALGEEVLDAVRRAVTSKESMP
jgi:hypothetical protein